MEHIEKLKFTKTLREYQNLISFITSNARFRCVSKENVTLRGSKNQIKMLPNDHEKCRDA